jgi:hypothetical protein
MSEGEDHFGYIEPERLAVFGRTHAAEPDVLINQLKEDKAVAEADTLLLMVPNQLGVDYNAHVMEAILTHVAPALGWPSGYASCHHSRPLVVQWKVPTRSPCGWRWFASRGRHG